MKGVGCLAIILHHLAFYGPMANVVEVAAPGLIGWLFDEARLAVQMFFVLGGYLVAARLAPQARPTPSGHFDLIWGRYKRLVTPFVFAVALATLVTGLTRPWFEHDSLSAPPSVAQWIAHGLLIHDLLGYQALSAGVWYVAIDFQLFIITVLLTLIMRTLPPRWQVLFPVSIIALSCASLFVINRHTELDVYALYFFGAYGLGMLAYWSNRSIMGAMAMLMIALLGTSALVIEFRRPVAVALVAALLVSLAARFEWLEKWPKPGFFTTPGQRSYSIFLIHYGVCIGINAIWHRYFPQGVVINVVGMMVATALSIGSGFVLYRYIESKSKVFGPNLPTLALALMIGAAFWVESVSW